MGMRAKKDLCIPEDKSWLKPFIDKSNKSYTCIDRIQANKCFVFIPRLTWWVQQKDLDLLADIAYSTCTKTEMQSFTKRLSPRKRVGRGVASSWQRSMQNDVTCLSYWWGVAIKLVGAWLAYLPSPKCSHPQRDCEEANTLAGALYLCDSSTRSTPKDFSVPTTRAIFPKVPEWDNINLHVYITTKRGSRFKIENKVIKFTESYIFIRHTE